MKRLLKWILGGIAGVLLVFATLLFARAFAARRLPPLKPWHQALSAEVTAKEITDSWTLQDYLRREDEVFRQMNETVLPAVAPEDRTPTNRYWADGPLNPERFPKNWNRTTELVPDGPIRGGALLVHGLTDAPYSMRAEAELLRVDGLLRALPPDAGARHGAGRADEGGLAGLAGGAFVWAPGTCTERPAEGRSSSRAIPTAARWRSSTRWTRWSTRSCRGPTGSCSFHP